MSEQEKATIGDKLDTIYTDQQKELISRANAILSNSKDKQHLNQKELTEICTKITDFHKLISDKQQSMDGKDFSETIGVMLGVLLKSVNLWLIYKGLSLEELEKDWLESQLQERSDDTVKEIIDALFPEK